MTRAAAMLSLFLVVSPAVAAIRGRVVGAGRPVAKAKVTAYAVESAPETMARAVENRPRVVLAATQSAADGTFALPVDGNGAVAVRVDAPGFAPSMTEEVLGDEDVLIGLVAASAHEITLRSDGGPLAGARVIVFFASGISETAADDRGRFALAADRAASLLVIHPRAALHPLFLQAHADVVDVERDVALKGKVVDARGEGVAGAKVSIDDVPAAVSAADGSFTIERAPRSYMQLSAEAGDLGGVAGAAVGTAVIRVGPRVAVAGVVRDAEKRPLRGVTLMLVNESGGDFAVSDAKGAFAFHVAPGNYTLMGGGAAYHVEPAMLDARNAVVKDAVATHVPTIGGIVRKADGAPVEGAQVALAMEAARDEYSAFERIAGIGMFPHATTGPDGRFRIAAMPFEQPVVVVAYKRGLPPAQSGVIAPGKSARELSIVIGAGTEDVGGTVKDPAGHPVPGVAVMALPSGRVIFGAFDDAPLTDGEGRFAMRLPKGTWRMTFAKDGYLPEERARVEVAAPVTSMAVELAPAASIRGHVVRKSGGGVESVTIFEGTTFATTSADGSFALQPLRAGEHVLQYMTRSGVHGEQRVTAPAPDARIVLDDGGIVRGRVVDAAGAPVTSYQVTVTRSSETNFLPQQISDDDGRFAVNDAPAGETMVSVQAKGFAPASRSGVVVEAGKATDEIVLTLRRGRTVRGKVVSAAGDPLADVKISMNRRSDEESVTNADGTFEVGGLDTTLTWLSFAKSGFITSMQKVAAGDGDAQLDVQLRPGVTLTGRVLAPGGEPLPDVQVAAESSVPGAEMASIATTNENGEFRMEGLAPARYTLKAGGDKSIDGASTDSPEGVLKDVDVERVHEVTIRTTKPVHGVIYGEVFGTDLAGKEITINLIAGDQWTRGRGDGAGKYRIAEAPVGTVTVQASVAAGGGIRWSHPVVVDVPPHGETRVDLRFDDTFPIAGRVLREGTPMIGATVTFTDGESNQFTAATGEGGAYHIALAAGHYTVSVGSYSVQHDVAGPATIDVNVELTKVTVAVVDAATGAPLAAATVSGRDSTSSTHAAVTGTTGIAGQVTLELPRSVSDVVVEKDGYATAAVAANAPSLVVKLARSDGATLRIVDARDGRPLTGYAIARDAQGRVLASANEAAPDGTIRFALAPGRYRFSASTPDYGSHTVAADVPGPDVLIPLPRGGKLLLQSRAEMHADARLIEPGGEEYVRCWCNGIAGIRIGGRATVIDSVAPGSYTLEIRQAGMKPRTIPVSVIEGETVTVALDP